MAADFGKDMKIIMYADSSAAIAISKRRGSGKLRHINVGLLWIQEKVESEELVVKKVKGVSNPADMMTKAVHNENLHKYMVMTKQRVAEGRAQESLKIKRSEQGIGQEGSQQKINKGLHGEAKMESRLATKCVSSKEECKALGVR